MLENPAIKRAMDTGYPGGEPKWPTCPVCGKGCDVIYQDTDKYVVGCNICVKALDAWEYQMEEEHE